MRGSESEATRKGRREKRWTEMDFDGMIRALGSHQS